MKAVIARAVVIKIGAVLSSFVLTMVLTRVMDQEQFGQYSLAITWVTLLSIIAPLGFPQLILRERAGTGGVQRATLLLTTGTILAFGVVGLAAAWSATLWLASDWGDLVPVATLMLPTWGVIRVSSGIISGAGLINLGQAVDTLARPLLLLAAVGGVWWRGRQSLDAKTVLELSLVTMAGLAVFVIWQGWANRGKVQSAQWKANTLYSSSLWASVVIAAVSAAQLAMSSLDTLIIGWTMSVKDVALYRSAVLQCLAFTSISEVLNVFLRPKIPAHLAAGRARELETLIARATQWATMFAFAGWLTYAAVGAPLSAWIFGEKYREAFDAALILMGGQVAMIAIGPVDTVLIMGEKERVMLRILLAGIAPFALLAWTFGQRWGIEGVAVACVAVNVAQRLAGSLAAFKLLGMRVGLFLSWR